MQKRVGQASVVTLGDTNSDGVFVASPSLPNAKGEKVDAGMDGADGKDGVKGTTGLLFSA